jgi:hypothetical protein
MLSVAETCVCHLISFNNRLCSIFCPHTLDDDIRLSPLCSEICSVFCSRCSYSIFKYVEGQGHWQNVNIAFYKAKISKRVKQSLFGLDRPLRYREVEVPRF